MKIRTHPLAEGEITKAAAYFESQSLGLGTRFLDEIDEAIRAIGASPLAWPIVKSGFRKRALIAPFPYSIYFRYKDGEVAILAVAHQSRREDYWINRR